MDSTSAQPTTLDQGGFYTDCITFRLGQGDGPRGNWDVSGDRGDNWGTYFQRNLVSIFSSFLQNLTAASRAWENWIREAHDSMSPPALEPVCRTKPGGAGAGDVPKPRRLLPACELGPTCAPSALPQGGHLHTMVPTPPLLAKPGPGSYVGAQGPEADGTP